MSRSSMQKISIVGIGFVGLSTAVVCAFKEIKTICVDADNSSYNNYEIIVVDNGSSDGSSEIVAKWKLN